MRDTIAMRFLWPLTHLGSNNELCSADGSDYSHNPVRNLTFSGLFYAFTWIWTLMGKNRRVGGMVCCGRCTVWVYGLCVNANLLLHCCTITILFLPNERLINGLWSHALRCAPCTTALFSVRCGAAALVIIAYSPEET